jgi:glycolate oxidase
VIFGHAGDGNLHPNILFDRRDPEQMAKVEPMAAEIFQMALDLGGTLSGEHGIGTLKLPYMRSALGSVSIDLQRRVKHALDPQGILNPGKVLPED